MRYENRAERGALLGGLETISSLEAESADSGNRTGPGLGREFPSAIRGFAGALDDAFGTITGCVPGSHTSPPPCAARFSTLFDHTLPCLRSLQGDRSHSSGSRSRTVHRNLRRRFQARS